MDRTNLAASAYRAAPALLGLVLLAAASAAAGPVPAVLNTFADGSAALPLEVSTVCSETATPGWLLPRDANVTSATLREVWDLPAASSASVLFDIGGDATWDITTQYTGPSNESSVALPPQALNSFLARQAAGAGSVTVPLRLQACGSTNGSVVLDTLRINYKAEAPATPQPPEQTAPFPSVALGPDNGWSARLTLSDYFADPDGGELAYSVERIDPAAPAWADLSVSVDGDVLVLQSSGNWSGVLALVVLAEDPSNLKARSEPLVVSTSAAPGSPPPADPDLAATFPAVGAAAVSAVALIGLGTALAMESTRYALLSALVGILGAAGRHPTGTDHFMRGRLYQLVRDRPGVRFRELIRLAEVSNGSGVHHLRVLEEGGFVRAVRSGRQTQFFATDHPLREDEYGLLDYERTVLGLVAGRPGLSVKELAAAGSMSLSTASRAVAQLTRSGHLVRDRRGRNAALHLREGSRAAPAAARRPQAVRTDAGGPAP